MVPSSGKVKISGNDASRIFSISGTETDVTIDDLTLVNGYAEGAGGAILHTGKTLSLTNTEFKHNQAVGTETEAAAGGAVAILAISPWEITRVRRLKTADSPIIKRLGQTAAPSVAPSVVPSIIKAYLTITGSTLTHNVAFGGDDNENQGQFAFVGLAFGGAINNNNGGTMSSTTAL